MITSSHKENNQRELQNEYAFDVKWQPIYIDKAISGRKGYFCMGCKKEMEAVKAHIANRRSYFRHIALDLPAGEKPCYYSDETFRHKLVKDLLQSSKSVKVPNVYKYPPKCSEGKAILIAESKTITAATIHNELYFYEDDNGNIVWSKKPGSSELLIQPDVTFFDSDGKPILLIEIVATHKIDKEKLIKIRHLGIDTIEIQVPRDSQEIIEKSILSAQRTKWIYNYEQESSEYIPNSISSSTEIPFFDEDPNAVFAESFKCRSAEINNLIRAFERCMESGEFRNAEQRIRGEISKVERNTEEFIRQQRELQARIRDDVESEFGERRIRIADEKAKIAVEERQLHEKYKAELKKHIGTEDERLDGDIRTQKKEYSNLEGRYLKKAGEIRKEKGEIEQKQGIVEDDIRREQSSVRQLSARRNHLRSRIESVQRSIEGLPGNEENLRNSLERIRGNIWKEKESILEIERDIYKAEDRSAQLQLRDESEIRRTHEETQRRIRREEESLFQSIKNRSLNGNDEFTHSCKKLLDDLASFQNWPVLDNTRRRIEKARNYILFGDYKNWTK